jgi:hypothetical protein
MDTHYTAGWFTRLARRLGICWVGTLPRGPRSSGGVGGSRSLSWPVGCAFRGGRGLACAAAVTVYAPTYGTLRLVVTRNRHGNHESLATSEPGADLTLVVARKHSRWSVETIFRDTKQYAGLGACQCWTDQAMSATSPWSWSASSCCNGCASTPASPSVPSRSAGSWPSPAKASQRPCP